MLDVVKHKTRYTLVGAVAAFVSQISSCGTTEFVTGESATRRPEQSVNSEDQQSITASERALNAIVRLQKPSIGLAQTANSTVPAISPGHVQHESLFFQVYRCPAEQRIRGLFELFDESHPSLTEQDSARKFYERNQFWTDITRNCSQVSGFHPQSELLDITSPSGSWKWYIRACILTTSQHKLLCNPAVSATDSLNGFRSNLNDSGQQLLLRISRKISFVNQISMTLPDRANALMVAIDACDTIEWDKAKRALHKSILLNVIGMGAAIALEIFAPTQNGHSSWQEKLKTIWTPAESTQIQGQAITRILLWLFTNQNDFHESCIRAEEIRAQAMTETLLLKSMQLELADDLVEAERLALPLPAGIRR